MDKKSERLVKKFERVKTANATMRKMSLNSQKVYPKKKNKWKVVMKADENPRINSQDARNPYIDHPYQVGFKEMQRRRRIKKELN